MRSSFIGECNKNIARTIVIKTHRLCGKDKSIEYDKAVLIIRNLFDALLAEFNRLHSGKTSVAPKQLFISNGKFMKILAEYKRYKAEIYPTLE